MILVALTTIPFMHIKNFSLSLLSAVLLAVFFASTPLLVSHAYASTASLSLSELVEFLIALEVISPDKADLAREAASKLNNVDLPKPMSACISPTGPVLKSGSRGSEVTSLQQYLAQDLTLYPEREVSGYFGPATERAVQRFQSKNGIVTSGSSATTGYGVVGPQTRAVMARKCGAGGATDVATPVIYSRSPASVPLDGTSQVTLRGAGFAQDAYVAIEGSSVTRLVPSIISVEGNALSFVLPEDAAYKDGIVIYVVNPGAPETKSNGVTISVTASGTNGLIQVSASPKTIVSDNSVTYTITAKDPRVKMIGMTLVCEGVTEVRAKGGHECGETIIRTPAVYPYKWKEWYSAPDGGVAKMEVSPLDADGNKFYPLLRHTVTTEIVGIPALKLSTDTLTFTRIVDENRFGDEDVEQILIKNPTEKPLRFKISFKGSQPAWINSGYVTDVLTVDPDGVMGIGAGVKHDGLAPGTYRATMLLTGDFDPSPAQIQITLVVKEDTELTLRAVPDHLEFQYVPGADQNANQTQLLVLANKTGKTVHYRLVEEDANPGWLDINADPDGFVARSDEQGRHAISVNAAGLEYGIYKGNVIIDGDFANAPMRVPVTLIVHNGQKG